MKKIITVLLSVLLLSSCGKEGVAKEEVVKEVVRFYGWGGDSNVNNYLDDYIAPLVKEKHNIDFIRVPMNIDEILLKLTNEKEAGVDSGDIDIMWINGENFYNAKEIGLLSEPFTTSIENYSKNIDLNAEFANMDFNTPIEGLEVPWGLARLVLIGNTNKIDKLPKNSMELLDLVKENKGMMTYPALPDFTGSAFVRMIMNDVLGEEVMANLGYDKEEIRIKLMPAFDYLNELEKYLWMNGETYPKDTGVINKMYSDGQLLFTLSYTALLADRKVLEGEFEEGTKAFIFENGTLGNAHYLAKPFNVPNSEGANKVINELISFEAQIKKMDVNGWGDLAVLDMDKLNDEEKEIFKNTSGSDILELETYSEVDAKQIAIIEELWEEEVLRK